MSVNPDELRLTSALMLAAYVGMGVGAFLPAWRARRAVEVTVRDERNVPSLVEALWTAVQGVLMAGLLAAVFAQGSLRQSPASLLAFTSLPLTLAGALAFLAGCSLAAWAALHLGEELTVQIQTREGGNLVTTGPYGAMRHPIYTGILLMVGGLAAALAAPLVALWAAIALYCATVRARAEEDLLLADPIHGGAYREYLARTGRFLPRVRQG